MKTQKLLLVAVMFIMSTQSYGAIRRNNYLSDPNNVMNKGGTPTPAPECPFHSKASLVQRNNLIVKNHLGYKKFEENK